MTTKLSRSTDHIYWLPSELWNIIGNVLKMDLINKINKYKINIPRTLIFKHNYTIGNYDYAINYKFNENGTIESSVNMIS